MTINIACLPGNNTRPQKIIFFSRELFYFPGYSAGDAVIFYILFLTRYYFIFIYRLPAVLRRWKATARDLSAPSRFKNPRVILFCGRITNYVMSRNVLPVTPAYYLKQLSQWIYWKIYQSMLFSVCLIISRKSTTGKDGLSLLLSCSTSVAKYR